jgi:hypothetical protein
MDPVGSKYKPSIKDLKATLRFHQNARRAAATGAVRKSVYISASSAKRSARP